MPISLAQHGTHSDETLHPVATESTRGFMPKTVKAKLDAYTDDMRWDSAVTGTCTTTDNTTSVLLLSYTPPTDNKVYDLFARMVAYEATEPAGYAKARIIAAKRIGGVVTLIGSNRTVATDRGDHSEPTDAGTVFVLNGSAIELRVTGRTGVTLQWRGKLWVMIGP